MGPGVAGRKAHNACVEPSRLSRKPPLSGRGIAFTEMEAAPWISGIGYPIQLGWHHEI